MKLGVPRLSNPEVVQSIKAGSDRHTESVRSSTNISVFQASQV
jgi:hypothetical protein